jgi:phage terminase large subunit-like protein
LTLRELARRQLRYFVQYRFLMEGRPLFWNWHLDYLCELLEGVHERDPAVQFMVISIWPGSLKSETIGQCFQGWMIGRDDSANSAMVSASNSADLAERDSDKTRQMLKSDWYKTVFPKVGLDRTGKQVPWPKDTEAKWATPAGAFRESVSPTSNTTGRGARRVLWDDPLAAKDGTSDAVRMRRNQWLGETMRTRLRDQVKGTITGVMQRLHELDPVGWLKEKCKIPGATPYRFVDIPLECEKRTMYFYRRFDYTRQPGEIGHLDMFPPAVVKQLKIEMGDNFDGQYNQKPVKMAGTFFKIDHLQLHDMTAEKIVKKMGLRPAQFWDFAITEKETQKDDPDWSVCVTWAKDEDNHYWILDVWRDRIDGGKLAGQIMANHIKWGKCPVYGEDGIISKLIRKPLRDYCLSLNYPLAINPLPSGGIDKVRRALPFQMALHTDVVHAPASAPWLQDMLLELAAFPKGSHDDQVDALAYAAAHSRTMPAEPPLSHPNQPGKITGAQADAMIQRTNKLMSKDEDDGTGERWW